MKAQYLQATLFLSAWFGFWGYALVDAFLKHNGEYQAVTLTIIVGTIIGLFKS